MLAATVTGLEVSLFAELVSAPQAMVALAPALSAGDSSLLFRTVRLFSEDAFQLVQLPEGLQQIRLASHMTSTPLSITARADPERLAFVLRIKALREAGVTHPLQMALVEKRMGFRLDLDPAGIQKRAEELGRLFERIQLPIPEAYHNLPPNQKEAVAILTRAIRLLDTPYRIQSNPFGDIFEELMLETPALAPLLPYYVRFGGPYNFSCPDAENAFHSFLPGMEGVVRYAGGGMYPFGMTLEEFRKSVVANSPSDHEMRVIYRLDEKGQLQAVPYSIAFAKWLGPAAKLVEEAALLLETDLPKTAHYLRTVANAFRKNDFANADRAWVTDLPEGPFDMAIGAVEQYADKVRGWLAQFIGIIQIRNPASEANLSSFLTAFSSFEDALPVSDEYKKPVEQRRPTSLSPVETLTVAADHRGGELLARAYNQPNDSEIRRDTGFRFVLIENMGRARDDESQFGKRLLQLAFTPEQQALVIPLASSTFVLFHELSHSHGTEYVVGNPQVEALAALGPIRTTFEELRADIVGLFDAQTAAQSNLITEQLRQEIYVTYILRCLQVIASRGIEESHARGALVALNYFAEKRAITIDPETGQTHVDTSRMTEVVRDAFAKELMTLKGNGDKEGVERLYAQHGTKLPKGLNVLFGALEGIPRDIIVEYEYDKPSLL